MLNNSTSIRRATIKLCTEKPGMGQNFRMQTSNPGALEEDSSVRD
eukprot:CAMPEP_0203940932 /NCGR_PEP_ID=MMETSP0359-20131031/77406_1 /ASSEMBLY_ACC=CAM_ASM_000338 /TAXON_ID=268821 /ORGANISM="Scrippsiella Hangoei, Strain SHTV-5" /LENGTH=44 /DNA_ID= /DNA_START= /DNA_END= /DNA_ORIENTATION=